MGVRVLREHGVLIVTLAPRRMHVASASAPARHATVTRPIGFALLGWLVVAALSLLVVAPAPSYDPWAWLLWGRELAGGELRTAEGPAFKPLPVAVCALLSVLGPAAPWAWVLVARAAAVVAVWLAFRLGRRLAGGSVPAGMLAAVGVALCGDYLAYAASGVVTGLVLALALGGAEAWRAGRPRTALACGVGCGLLQVESWPFLLAAGLVLWRRRPRDRVPLAVCAVALPALWLVPELLASGDLLRSAERARIPNPGQPALADVPALASLREAAVLPLWPLWIGVVALAPIARRSGLSVRPAMAVAAVGLAWIAVVAAMAQAGFSGEPRYALPGAALLAVSGAVGLVTALPRRPHTLAALTLVGWSPSRRCRGSPTWRRCAPGRPTSGSWRATSPTPCGQPAGATSCWPAGSPTSGRSAGP